MGPLANTHWTREWYIHGTPCAEQAQGYLLWRSSARRPTSVRKNSCAVQLQPAPKTSGRNKLAPEPMSKGTAHDLRALVAPHNTNTPGVSGHEHLNRRFDLMVWDSGEPGGRHQPNRLRMTRLRKIKPRELGWPGSWHHELSLFWAIAGGR